MLISDDKKPCTRGRDLAWGMHSCECQHAWRMPAALLCIAGDIGCHALCQTCYVAWTGAKLCPVCRKPWVNPHVQYELLQASQLAAQLLERAPTATGKQQAVQAK